jgi:Fe2+ or Zn2+ uptake regulation protein
MLRDVNLRLTRQRIALGCILFGNGDRHVTAEMLYGEATKAKLPVSLATVYNTPRQFTNAGLLRPVAVDGSKIYFDTDVTQHHQFFVEGKNDLLEIPDGDVVVRTRPRRLRNRTRRSSGPASPQNALSRLSSPSLHYGSGGGADVRPKGKPKGEEMENATADKNEISRSDKGFAMALLRTHKEVPEITSEKQYELYLYLYRHLVLTANLTTKDDPDYPESMQAFARSRGGILAFIYRARIMKWKKTTKQMKSNPSAPIERPQSGEI